MKKCLKTLFTPRKYGYLIFWAANLLLLIIMVAGFGPLIGVEMLRAVQGGVIPPQFLVMAMLLTGLPIIAIAIAVKVFKNNPDKIFAFGYGVELPIFILLLMRLFVFQEMTASASVVMLGLLVGVSALMWQILSPQAAARHWLIALVRAVGLTMLLLMGAYVIIWLAFYAIPLAAIIIQGLISLITNIWNIPLPRQWSQLIYYPFVIVSWAMWSIVVLSAVLVFATIPIAVPGLYLDEWRRSLAAFGQHLGAKRGLKWVVPVVTILIMALFYTQVSQQPQHQAAALLTKAPANMREAEALLAQQERIRSGLLNAYLAPQRYLSAFGELDHIRQLYEQAFKEMPREWALQIQATFETWMHPFLYQPAFSERPPFNPARPWENHILPAETKRASELYEQFFDQPINKAERERIVNAVKSTWSATRANDAWQAVDDREIWLKSQQLTIDDQGLWADFELYEVYLNQTGLRQEVVYYFSLPESAVITGVWLGNGPERDKRFAYRVSPRGAAQSLYRNEVRQNRDPALVEQIGPRQYRLRVFPIEPSGWRWDANSSRSIREDAPEMHMWLTWRVIAPPTLGQNTWALPRLAEKRNVYWDATSQRQLNAAPMSAASSDATNLNTWLPPSVPRKPVEQNAAPMRIDLANGSTIVVGAVNPAALPKLPPEYRLALVIDRSRSMTRVSKELDAALNHLRQLGLKNSPDVYLTSPDLHPNKPEIVSLAQLTPAVMSTYGGQNPSDLVSQFNTLYQTSGRKEYDAVLVLTDDSGYTQGKELKVDVPNAPVWFVHLSSPAGAYPLGYDDSVLQAIQASGGGVAASVEEALARMAVARKGVYEADTADIVDGLLWLTLPTEIANARPTNEVRLLKPDHPLAAFAARRAILSEMQKNKGKLTQVATLDQLHALAKQYSIVTPYSSMIVLVNDVQRKQLDELEKKDDRFQREKETVGETTNEDNPTVTGVPEPEEWLLIGLAVSLLGWFMRSRRRVRVSG